MVYLKNYMEDVVEKYIHTVTKDMDICKCEHCKKDIMAISLNSLPAKYVVTKKGENYSKLNFLMQQFEVDVISEITKAAEVVEKCPRH